MTLPQVKALTKYWEKMPSVAASINEIRLILRAYFGIKGSNGASKRDQKLGEYCKGEDIEECRKMFGKSLEAVCSTCPN